MNIFLSEEKQQSIHTIEAFLEKELKISKKDLYSKVRSSTLSKARFVAWYGLYYQHGLSGPEIAEQFNKSPSAIHYGIQYAKTKGLGKKFYPTLIIK